MPAELIFETHAESVDNERGVGSGHYDAPLSGRGEQQARALGERYEGLPIHAIYCSDLQRSWRTAEIAFAGRGVPIVRTAALRECDYGELARRPLQDPARYALERYPGGESYSDVVLRVRGFLDDLRPLAEGQVVLIIGHRAVHYALEHLLRGVELEAAVTADWRWRPGWRYRL